MNLALFDFDGTITRGDTFSSFVRFAVRPSRKVVGGVLLIPVVAGYRLNVVSASRTRPIVARVAFQGEHAESVRELGRKYASDVIPAIIRHRAMNRIEWHQRQGDLVVVVSASLDAYLRPWCEAVGVRLICTELEERGGRLTGRYCHGDCSGAEKLRRILEQFDPSRYPLIYAYGDTSEDRDMLRLAHRKYYRWKEIGDWTDATSVRAGRPCFFSSHGCGIRDADAGWGTRDTGYGIRDTGYGIRDTGYGIRDTGFED